jgi:hypothetical protein
MRITETQLRQIIREELQDVLLQEGFADTLEKYTSKTADFFGGANRIGVQTKQQASDLLNQNSFENWNQASYWGPKLRAISRMGQNEAATPEVGKTLRRAKDAFDTWSASITSANNFEREQEYKKESDRLAKEKQKKDWAYKKAQDERSAQYKAQLAAEEAEEQTEYSENPDTGRIEYTSRAYGGPRPWQRRGR